MLLVPHLAVIFNSEFWQFFLVILLALRLLTNQIFLRLVSIQIILLLSTPILVHSILFITVKISVFWCPDSAEIILTMLVAIRSALLTIPGYLLVVAIIVAMLVVAIVVAMLVVAIVVAILSIVVRGPYGAGWRGLCRNTSQLAA